MYQVSDASALVRAGRLAADSRGERRVGRTVVLLGLTSFFTDISSEMVVAILPLYLASVGAFSPLAIGVVDGIYNGASALATLTSGFIGDRWRRHKEVAATGYGVSAVCKLLLLLAGTTVSAIGAIVLVDRAGKGIRTAPRDALISLSTNREEDLGRAFGVHRALDTAGALLGPVIAFAILVAAPLAFDSVFVASFCFALIGLAILVLFVEPQRRNARNRSATDAERPTLRRVGGLVGESRFRGLLIAGGLLSLATVSDAFVFLALEDAVDLGTTLFPLLFVGSAGVYMLAAIPMGVIADRVGRAPVLLAGYLVLALVYAALLSPLGGWMLVTVVLGGLGTYYAATDGILMALGSQLVDPDLRGSGLALLRTQTGIAKLLASIAFGAIWTVWGMSTALVCFCAALAVAILLAALLLLRPERAAHA